ncbi:MAG: hypothetical protein ACR2PL_25535, partial [Dehalococcoidia bacterium]
MSRSTRRTGIGSAALTAIEGAVLAPTAGVNDRRRLLASFATPRALRRLFLYLGLTVAAIVVFFPIYLALLT